ncbi:hypothetical protein D3C72_732570 [compost metagenome]
MPLAEEKALEILTELIKKPETKAEDIPRIWNEILEVYNKAYAPVVELPAKKKRRKSANPNIGWPAGVKRAEYTAWKDSQTAAGVSEGINPQEFKRLKDAGLIGEVSVPAAEPKAKPAKADKADKAEKPAKAAPKAKAGAKK